MREFPRPVIAVSKCLEFEACRYNGETIRFDFIRKLAPHVTFIPICPEVEIGLGVPRDPIRVVSVKGQKRLIQPATGKELSDKMLGFADTFLASLSEVDGFILKSRSPSCGIKDVKFYPDPETAAPGGRTSGFFAGRVMDRFPGLAIEDEGRLRATPR